MFRQRTGGAAATDILYYEVLDMPLEQLEQLKTFKVRYSRRHSMLLEQLKTFKVRYSRQHSMLLEQLTQFNS